MTDHTGGGGRARAIVRLLLLIITTTGAGGCATTIVPPPHPVEPVPVFITDYGRHSSLLLPHPGGGFTEYAFGDWNWFALKRTTSGDALQALFFSPASTLGRRQLSTPDNLTAITAGSAGMAARTAVVGKKTDPTLVMLRLARVMEKLNRERAIAFERPDASLPWFRTTS